MRYIRQEGLRDCGICSLLNIIKYYGGNIDIEKLRTMTKTNENGTSIYNLVNTANKLGFISKAYKCNIEDLEFQIFPMIGYIKLEGFNHFVIIDSINENKINIFDPIRGRITYTIDAFNKVFQNIVITFKREGELVKEKDVYLNTLLELFNNNKKIIIIISVLSLICAIFSFITSFMIKNVYDGKITINFILLLILILKIFFEFIKNKYSIYFDNKINYYISNKINTKIFSLPLSYHHSRPVGDITSKISDVYSIEDFIKNITFTSIIDIIFILLTLIVTLFINFKIFILIVFITLILIFINFYFKNEEKILVNELKNKYSIDNSVLIDNIFGIDTIKNLSIEDKIIEKQNKTKLKYLEAYQKYISYLSYENIFCSFIESYGGIFLLIIGIKKMSIGTLSMIYTIFISYIISLKNILNLLKIVDKTKISYKNINNLLKYEYIDGTKNIKNIYNISFNDVSYSYNGNRLISKFNLNINKGDIILLSGKSGSGKSTLFKLLNKELILKQGNILINNIDIKDIKVNSLKNNITYVSQNEYLFCDSIKNNITMFKNIKDKDLKKVLKITTLNKTLKNRNISLDYLLEENGHNLSGGERQKILLARTLLRNTDFIILDETMNELDIETEEIILNNIINEYNKTLVVISHRITNNGIFNKIVKL